MKGLTKNNPVAVAMRKRHPRRKDMIPQNMRRPKDAKNSWKNDIDTEQELGINEGDNVVWRDPDYLWQLPT